MKLSTFGALRQTVGEIYVLAKLSAGGRGWKIGLYLSAFVIAANLAGIYISVLLIDWNKAFFDALQKLDLDETIRQIGIYFILIFFSAALTLLAQYVQKLIFIRWRGRLNHKVSDAWLNGKAYWRLQSGLLEQNLDNPDQRISEDCRKFVDSLISNTLSLFTRIVGLFTYLVKLWVLTSFALQFKLFGQDISIPHYMVWSAFLYVFISSLITHWLGKPLKDLLFDQQQKEADYRFSLTRLRDWADGIAQANGEQAERRILDRRFGGIVDNWNKVIKREFILGCFTRPYFSTVFRVPMFLALPAYLAGSVTFGGLMQVTSAFSRVVNSLSFFIFYYRNLADWVATTNRLTGLLAITRQAAEIKSEISIDENDQQNLAVRGLSLHLPDGVNLDIPSEFVISKGEHVWLSGPSGVGKSTLLKAFSGLWIAGSGSISRPKDWRPFFASQDPYLPLNGMAGAVTYPLEHDGFDEGELVGKMDKAGLGHRSDELNADCEKVVRGLSGGEKQRAVFLRILMARPDWIFLDESTSALDKISEEQLLNLLLEYLPGATIIFISHQEPLFGGPWRKLSVGTKQTST